ncbi:hypothetical protein pEaSNUABM49_00406 [Erwinia phage pEa_SNUABM_49]|nr:hypothetical protein pEaSNUABM49_00406 [Erwinia phage pEa_SNUABM_49]
MDLNRIEVIKKLNELALVYQKQAQEVFCLFDYKFEFGLSVHFKDRVMQRYPTYEIAENLIKQNFDLFFKNHTQYISRAITEVVDVKLVNIRHDSLNKQNVIVLQMCRIDDIIKIIGITMFQKNTSYIKNNPNEFVLLHKPKKWTSLGTVGERLKRYAKKHGVPDGLQCLTQPWR